LTIFSTLVIIGSSVCYLSKIRYPFDALTLLVWKTGRKESVKNLAPTFPKRFFGDIWGPSITSSEKGWLSTNWKLQQQQQYSI